jgi:hypothetical protein
MAKLQIQGRLGNNLIQFISAFLFCEKHNLNLDFEDKLYNYQYGTTPYHYNLSSLLNKEMINKIKNNEYKKFDKEVTITDYNFFEYYDKEKIEFEITFAGYFLFETFLSKNREKIKELFNIKYDYVNQENCFIHYRLGDINNSELSLPIEYFEDAINKISFKEGYISSDSINDEKCQFLIKKYNLKVVNLNPYETIMFGKNFNNIILSESTFSFFIGYFSNAENIISNKRPSRWGIDFSFGIDSFTFLNWDYGPNGPTLI